MLLRIESERLSAEISPEGAELQRLADGAGRDYLWDGDPAFWAGRAPILFPIVGTLAADRYRWQGREYSLPRHGFARRRRFALVEHDRDRLILRLAADDATREVWPFDFELDMIFTLHGATLTMTARVANRDVGPMPVSFGFHPALRRPLPGAASAAGHVIRFARNEPAPIRRLDADGLLDPKPRSTPVEGDLLAIDDALFAEDALIFDTLDSRSLIYQGPGSTQVAIDFEGMPHLGLWAKPGAGYLCIEPWQGYSDPAGFERPLEEKPGMAVLPPGEVRSFTMAITIG